jgi:hypothetical protein
MKIQEISRELDGNPCPSCTDDKGVEASSAVASPTPSGPEIDNSTLKLIEAENAGLRRLIVDLIGENQRLRQRMNTAKDEHQPQSSTYPRGVDFSWPGIHFRPGTC